MKMLMVPLVMLALFARLTLAGPSEPLRVGFVGLVHAHVGGFFSGGALAPAGGVLNRPDVKLVGIVEPDQKLFDAYARRMNLSPSLHFAGIAEMIAAAHPQAVLVFMPPTAHRKVVEICAPLGVNVMMEKPLATTYADAIAIGRAAEAGKIHVLVNLETTWYPSNYQAASLFRSGELGPIVQAEFRDGHSGPAHMAPEFVAWLTDPLLGGDGALTDFGCYGPSLMTWMMNGAVPQSVTATTRRLQPDVYPKVDDEAEIILNYVDAVAVVGASWNWPVSVKESDLYGRTGYAKAIDSTQIEWRKARKSATTSPSKAPPIPPPYDDPLHYLEAVLSGQIQEGNDPSSLKTNVTVTEIQDAAFQSAKSGKTIVLPLPMPPPQ
jgi:predicted dehydrogenase